MMKVSTIFLGVNSILAAGWVFLLFITMKKTTLDLIALKDTVDNEIKEFHDERENFKASLASNKSADSPILNAQRDNDVVRNDATITASSSNSEIKEIMELREKQSSTENDGASSLVKSSDKPAASSSTASQSTSVIPLNDSRTANEALKKSLTESPRKAAVAPIAKSIDVNWVSNVCGSIKDSVCHEVFVVPQRKVTFCSAAKVASTTTKQYFYDIADGALSIPENSKYGVHEANWMKLHFVDEISRREYLTSPHWTHVFIWKHALERFVSGYLDKVVRDCENTKGEIKPHLAIHYYKQFGFSCEKHKGFESFITFMESVPKFEGHFAQQTPLCSVDKFPYTDFIGADENFSLKLEMLSAKLGVHNPKQKKKTSLHKTKSKTKMVKLFKGKPLLVKRVLEFFKDDCVRIPDACDITELLEAI